MTNADSVLLPLPPLAVTSTRAASLAWIIARLVVEARLEPHASGPDFAQRAMRTARTILQVHGVDIRCSGPRVDGASILVANHVSYLDPLVVSAVVPCVAIAKGETRQWPLIGRGLRALGVLFVQRGDAYSGATALRRAWRALSEGAAVLNFPEGTTSDGKSVGPFRRGIFGLSRLARVPIVPVRVRYDDPRLPWVGGEAFVPHYWRLAGSTGVVARVRLGEPIVPEPTDDAAALARRAREVIATL